MPDVVRRSAPGQAKALERPPPGLPVVQGGEGERGRVGVDALQVRLEHVDQPCAIEGNALIAA
eukprot:4574205-Alexandrium_andersonii.AAC.1